MCPTLLRAQDQEKCPFQTPIDSIYCLVLMLQGRSRGGLAHLIGGQHPSLYATGGLSLMSLLYFGKAFYLPALGKG